MCCYPVDSSGFCLFYRRAYLVVRWDLKINDDDQCDQIGLFLKVLVTNYIKKVPQTCGYY